MKEMAKRKEEEYKEKEKNEKREWKEADVRRAKVYFKFITIITKKSE